MLIHQRNLLVPLIMQRILIEHSIERPDVVIVGIPNRELAACDVDVMNFLLVGPLKDGGGVGGH